MNDAKNDIASAYAKLMQLNYRDTGYAALQDLFSLANAEYYPMARAIIGGLAFSTVVSLLVVPALYAYFDTLATWGRNVMRTARREGPATGVPETAA